MVKKYTIEKPEIINSDRNSDIILVCDHASGKEPEKIRLGISDADLSDHIAIDIGAADVTRQIARMMSVTAVLAPVSRLVIDCNRSLDDDSLIPAVSDGVSIPANQHISPEEKTARISAYYDPFHTAINDRVQSALADGKKPFIIAIHSFTPVLQGVNRPWDIGFLWNKDQRLAQALIGLLERETDLTIGDNEPYSGKQLYHSMGVHGERHRLAQTTIEIRNDHIGTPGGVDAWSRLLADCFDECLTRKDLLRLQ